MEQFGIMRIKDFSKMMGISESTIRTWKLRKEIPESCFKKIGGTVFIKVKEMEEFLAK